MCIGLAVLLFLIGVAVVVPSIFHYGRTSQDLSLLGQFQWFDELLTATRMTEITPTPTVSNLALSLDGLSEAIYRGVRGAQDELPEQVKDVPAIVKPIVDEVSISPTDRRESSVSFSGKMEEEIHVPRETRRKFNFLLAEEAAWLRQLVQTGRWKLFSTRFLKLKSDIIEKARINQATLVDVFINEWQQCLKFNNIFHSFSEFRRLVHHMMNLDLLLDKDKELIEKLLIPDENEITKPAVAYVYHKLRLPFNEKIVEMFFDYSRDRADEIIDGFGPPNEQIRLEEYMDFLESMIEERIGQTRKILTSRTDVNLDKIKQQDYKLPDETN